MLIQVQLNLGYIKWQLPALSADLVTLCHTCGVQRGILVSVLLAARSLTTLGKMTRQTALQLATAGAVVGASGAAYLAYSSYAAKQTKDVILFLDGSKTGVRLTQQELPLLLASLEQQLHIRDARVFLLQVSSKRVRRA
jgi:hypothetical protein